MTFESVREQFPILKEYTYFNTARFCALPDSVKRIQTRYLQGLSNHGSWHFEEWSSKYEAARGLSASLMGASTESTFFVPNVSTGVNLTSLYLPRNKKVVLLKKDFPSVTLPWQSHGHDIEWCDYKAKSFYEDLENLLKVGNKILCASWIQSADGFELDLNRVFSWCKQYNITLVLDGTQGFGAIPFEVDPEISMVFLSSCFKWLLAGYGVAIGYVSDDLLPKFKAFQGWNSIDFGTGHAKTGAASMEVGNAMFLNVLALYESLKLMDQFGVESIYNHNLNFRTSLIAQLRSNGHSVDLAPDTRSSIFRVHVPEGKYEELARANIQVSKQKGKVRLSPHFYNNQADIEALLRSL